MNRSEHPTDAAVQRLPLDSDERVRLLSDPDAKTALFQEITRMPIDLVEPSTAPARRAQPTRRTLVRVGALATLSVAAVAGAVVLNAAGSTSVACHVSDTNTVVIDAVTGDPVTDCAGIWEEATGTGAPALTAYDNGSGGIGVLAADEPVPDGWTPTGPGTVQNIALIELDSSLSDVADGLLAQCRLLDDATSIATAELARLGLDGWTVVSDRGAADGVDSCTIHFLDTEVQQVVLIPMEGVVAPEGTGHLRFARDLSDTLASDCLTVEDAGGVARDLAAGFGWEAGDIDVHELVDDLASCTRVDVNVAGSVSVVLRGPASQ